MNYTLTTDGAGSDGLRLEEDDNGIYRLCVHEEAELGTSIQVDIDVDTNGVVMEATARIVVDVNVLGWQFSVETPDLDGFYIEEGMRFTASR